jgi:hypothetical protein
MISDTDLPHQSETLQQPPRSFKLQKLLVLIAAILLSILVGGTGWYLLGSRNNYNSVNRNIALVNSPNLLYQSQFKAAQFNGTATKADQISDAKSPRLVYINKITHDSPIFSALSNGSNISHLSPLLGYPSTATGNIFIFKDHKKMYFIESQNIWLTNTEGTQVKQITHNPTYEPKFNIGLLTISDEGNLLFYYYDWNDCLKCSPSQRNPYIHYGLYYYDLQNDKVTFMKEGEPGHNFIGFSDKNPVYFDKTEHTLYALDKQTGKMYSLAKIPYEDRLHMDSYNLFLDSKNHNLIAQLYYYQGDPNSSNYIVQGGEIYLYNYMNGKKTKVSPNNASPKYYLEDVSANYTNILYRQDSEAGTHEYYTYNTQSKQTTVLNIKNARYDNGWVEWVDDDNFVYKDHLGHLYRYDLKTNQASLLPIEPNYWLSFPQYH